RIALLTIGYEYGGGVPSVVNFLRTALEESSDYHCDIFSLATSATDPHSVLLRAPMTWWKGIDIVRIDNPAGSFHHVGAFLTEFEFQRYRPRPVLTHNLDDYDLVQVVAGGPAAAFAATRVRRPVCAFVATTSRREREPALQQSRGVQN